MQVSVCLQIEIIQELLMAPKFKLAHMFHIHYPKTQSNETTILSSNLKIKSSLKMNKISVKAIGNIMGLKAMIKLNEAIVLIHTDPQLDPR